MGSNFKTHSILPFLNKTRSTISLCFYHYTDPEVSVDSSTTLPFRLSNQSNQFEKIIHGYFCTKDGRPIKQVLLYLQNDVPVQTNSTFKQITNNDIDRLWRNRFAWSIDIDEPETFIDLANDFDSTKKILPFRPIFYCRTKDVFFSPPCPNCGSLLNLCVDDDLLITADLQPYSSSLRRYLYCADCSKNNNPSDFYTKKTEERDPQFLNDCAKLIEKFSLFLKKYPSTKKLPCASCKNLSACYGSEFPVHNNILPISFYPFHMHVYKSPDLNALDFMAILSGCSIEEVDCAKHYSSSKCERPNIYHLLKRNWQRPLSINNSDQFGEILLQKLFFLYQVTKVIFPQIINQKLPGDSIELEQFWVTVFTNENLFPPSLNFVVSRLGIGFDHNTKIPQLISPVANDLHSTAYLWFHFLLTNKKQSKDHVYDGIADVINNNTLMDFESFIEAITKGGSRQFLPENIFWNPKDITIDASWREHWFAALKFGWSLLRISLKNENWEHESFQSDLKNLIKKVKKSISVEEPTSHFRPKSVQEDDNPIIDILTDIKKGWQANSKQKNDEILATQILKKDDEISKKSKLSETNIAKDDYLATQIIQSGEKLDSPESIPNSEHTPINLLETQEIAKEEVESKSLLSSQTGINFKDSCPKNVKPSKIIPNSGNSDKSKISDKRYNETETVMMSREELDKLLGKD